MEDTQDLGANSEFLHFDDVDQDLDLDPVERVLKREGYNPLKWSIEQVRKCDVMVHLFNDRI